MTIKAKLIFFYFIIAFLFLLTSFIGGQIGDSLTAFFISSGIAVIGFILYFFLISKAVINPMVQIKKELDQLHNGKKDNGQNLILFKGNKKDELSIVSKSLNTLLSSLYGSMGVVKQKTNRLKENDNILAQNMEKTVTEILESNTLNGIITGKMVFQNQSIQESAGSSEDIFALWNKLQEMIKAQANSIIESSLAVEMMVNSLNSSSRLAQEVGSNAAELLTVSKEGGLSLEKSVSSILELSKISSELNEMIAIIKDIASKTNLLSMNASIEAAHAGVHGKGFAVVANEIRVLAEKTAENAKYISKKLKTNNEKLTSASKLSKTAGEQFKKIFEEVSLVTQFIKKIKHTMLEQVNGGNELLDYLKVLNEQTSNVKDSSSLMKEKVDSLITRMSELKEIAKETMGNTRMMDKSIETIQKKVENVQKLMETNSLLIKEVEGDINKFKEKE